MCLFPQNVDLTSPWSSEENLPAHMLGVSRAQRVLQEQEPALGSSCSQVPLPPSEGMFEVTASRLGPLSSSPPNRARGNLNLLKDWFLGCYCSETSAFSEAFFACTTARWVNYFIFLFCRKAFLVTLPSARFEIGESFRFQASPFGDFVSDRRAGSHMWLAVTSQVF